MPTAGQSRDTRMTRRPRYAPNYDRRLTRHVVLADGRRLRTLKDAADLLIEVFGSVNARSGALDQAIEQLNKATRTGKPAHVQGATDAIERALREWRLL